MVDPGTETMLSSDRHPCRHCDPSRLRLEAASQQMDRLKREVERRLNEEPMRLIGFDLPAETAY